MAWDPAQYLAFAGERLHPAVDLLNRIPLESPRTILDLGCGAGNVTRLLAERWPDAVLTGVDSSPEMLEKARQTCPRAAWIEADLNRWEPPQPVDLLFSNAALHWLEDHGVLFPRLAAWVRPGGVLAVQMPASHDLPHHRAAFEIACSPGWRSRFLRQVRFPPVHPLGAYRGWLAPVSAGLDLWETTYLHLLEGPDPVTGFFKGSLLVPYLEALPAGDHAAFLAAYAARVREAYPAGEDGRVGMPFRRIFIVARR